MILMVHKDFQDGGQSVVILQILCLFHCFIENRKTIYLKCGKKRFPESCLVSTVQFMVVVYVEPEESEFSRCLCLRMMHREDGVMSG